VADGDPALDSLRAAIEQFGREHAAEVVADARAEAVSRATSILADSMTRALLEGAREELGGQAPTARPAAAASERATNAAHEPGELAHYVYGIVSADAEIPAGLDGVHAGEPVFTVEHNGLSAIASLVPLSDFGERELHENLNDVGWLERTARAHESVLDAALAATTVVPLRLCTIYRGAEQVREVLDREHSVFDDALRRLEGKTEWSVKLIAEPGALERAVSADDGEYEADVSPGVAYMRGRSQAARAREEADEVAEDWAGHVHARAAAHAAEALLNPLQNPELSGHEGAMLLNGVYLVDDASVGDLRKEVAALAAEFEGLGAAVQLTGPWPPYNFVKGSIEAAR
jgi:hypothetical protein